MAAFDHAVSLGVDGLECDVHLSRDGVPVLIHDATLDRTTDAAGPVSLRTALELDRVDAGARFAADSGAPHRGLGIGVPRLADLLDRHPDVPVIVEIKGEQPDLVPVVLATLRASRNPSRYLIGGFSQTVLDAVRQLAPEYPTGASKAEVVSAIRRAYLRIRPRRTGYAVFQVPFVFQGKEVFGPAFVRTVARAGVAVQSWVIDDEPVMHRLVDWGVVGLISDRPDLAVQVAARPRGLPV